MGNGTSTGVSGTLTATVTGVLGGYTLTGTGSYSGTGANGDAISYTGPITIAPNGQLTFTYTGTVTTSGGTTFTGSGTMTEQFGLAVSQSASGTYYVVTGTLAPRQRHPVEHRPDEPAPKPSAGWAPLPPMAAWR